jgi:hypothetical protein
MEGPGKTIRWGVNDGTRSVASGDLVHDDYVLSAALIAQLDEKKWGTAESQVIEQPDILKELTF